MSSDPEELPDTSHHSEPALVETVTGSGPQRGLSFEDGNTLFIAGDRTFLLHRGVIASVSTVFKDLFENARLDAVDAERIDGHPVLRVSDSAEGFEHLVCVLYDRQYMRIDLAVPLAHAAAVLELAYKYQIDTVRDEVMQLLTGSFPASPWSTLQTKVAFQRGEEIILANLARKHNIRPLLLPAMYACCTLPIKTLLGGVDLADGSRIQLSAVDMRWCVAKKEFIRKEFIKRCWPALGQLFSDARDHSRCRALMGEALIKLKEDLPMSFVDDRDLLRDLGRQPQVDKLCPGCGSRSNSIHKAKLAMWKELKESLS